MYWLRLNRGGGRFGLRRDFKRFAEKIQGTLSLSFIIGELSFDG